MAGEAGGDVNGLRVDVDGVLDLSAVASCHGDNDGDLFPRAYFQDHFVTMSESLLGDLPAAEAVAGVWVCPGEIDDQIGLGE